MTDDAARCLFCAATSGPFAKVEGLITVLMCVDCQAARGHGAGPYPVMTRAEMREPGVAARLGPRAEGHGQPPGHRHHAPAAAAGQKVARMYQESGLAWLERQAEAAEDLLAERQATDHPK